MNAFLLIGPSCSGKTTVCNIIKRKRVAECFHLDHLIIQRNHTNDLARYYLKVGHSEFCRVSYEIIISIIQQKPEKLLLFDVGAGSLECELSFNYFKKFNIIYLHCNEIDFYKRHKNRGFTEDQIKSIFKSSYEPHKTNLYNSAVFVLDTSSFDPDQSANVLIDYLTAN